MSIFDEAMKGIENTDKPEATEETQESTKETQSEGKKKMHNYGQEFREAFPDAPGLKKD